MTAQFKNDFVNLSLYKKGEGEYSESENEALSLVLDYLKERNENLSLYYIRFRICPEPNILIAELRHKTLFTEDGVYNPGPRISVGGTSRDIRYDTQEKKIVKVTFMR